MYLLGFRRASNAFDLVWNVISGVSGGTQASGPSAAASAVGAIVSNPPPLFALVIGIDEYMYDDFAPLKCAVADAQAIKTYLETSLGVPTSQIKTLFNKEATRDAIIASLRDLGENKSINRGDPILIYYAGHGSTSEAPDGWHW